MNTTLNNQMNITLHIFRGIELQNQINTISNIHCNLFITLLLGSKYYNMEQDTVQADLIFIV